ncbi:hypothetical protein MNBD_PLANCTO03-100 [hydrothermal vent metagenome]|uniref:Uncharacterized protein n=1 Tax=hydrothermal vent metagenome TaxID=652676 RepID=A0A3B1D9I4_9ZZZZ
MEVDSEVVVETQGQRAAAAGVGSGPGGIVLEGGALIENYNESGNTISFNIKDGLDCNWNDSDPLNITIMVDYEKDDCHK